MKIYELFQQPNEINYNEFYQKNSVLNVFQRIAESIMTKNQKRDLVFNIVDRDPINFWWTSFNQQEDYKFFLDNIKSQIDLRWKIIKAFQNSIKDAELFNSPNVFKSFLKSCINIRAFGDEHVLHVFKWMEEKFRNSKIFTAFVFDQFSEAFGSLKTEKSVKAFLKLILNNLISKNFCELLSINIRSFTSYHNIGLEGVWLVCSKIFDFNQMKVLLQTSFKHENFLQKIIQTKRHELMQIVLEDIKKKASVKNCTE